MADRRVKIWYDAEGDYLEVTFDPAPGYYRETSDDQVMERVDVDGRLLGFSVTGVTAIRDKPIEVAL